jgi:hypothetical protein
MWYYSVAIMLKKLKIIPIKARYLLLILFLSMGFLPLQNTAICIDNDGHSEFEYVDKSSKKCSEFNLAVLENQIKSQETISSSEDHCGTCDDLLLSSNSFILKTINFNFNIIPSIIGNMGTYFSTNNALQNSIDFINHKTAFNSSTVLSIKSVKILC